LIHFFEDDRLELYNLRADISEDINLAGELPDLAEKLRAQLAGWRQRIEAKIPEVNQDYQT
jgi:hypothetical protein